MGIDAVVFVPGICGSILKDGDETIWPGRAWSAVFGSYPEAYVNALASNARLKATDVLRSVPIEVLGVTVYHVNGYQKALDCLESLSFCEKNGTLIPFAYDWRLNIQRSAEALKDRLARRDLAGRTIAIVAHSMGGLVSRYMLEKLGAPSSIRVALCVLVAVPHLGAPVVLQNILGLRPEIFLTARQCKDALCSPSYPSAYQLLPRLGVPALLENAVDAPFAVRDPYNASIVSRLQLVSSSVDAAQEFGGGIEYIVPGFIPPCQYVAIVGNAQKTTTANYLEGSTARAVEEATAGDGTVPLWSAAPPGIPIRYVAATHGGMFDDGDTIAMLRAVLRPDWPGGRTFTLEPGVAPPVLSVQALASTIETGTSYTVAVVADHPTEEIDAVLEVQALFEGRRDQQDVSIAYKGGPLRSLSVDLKAPADPALLTFRVRDLRTQVSGAGTSVVVLRP